MRDPKVCEMSYTDHVSTDFCLLDVVIFLSSVAVAALRKPLLVIKVALPYIILLILFAGFVVWNGSVVLGERYCQHGT